VYSAVAVGALRQVAETSDWLCGKRLAPFLGELVPALEAMLELVFEKGRPSNRAVLQAVFAKTPLGRQQSSAAREVNQALRTLRGHTLQEVRLSASPSRHTLVVETDRCRVTLEFDKAGARVASLEAG